MTLYKKWDIVLVPFPFTNLTTTKQRPALVVSPDQYNQGMDIVIAFITSKMDIPYRHGDFQIDQWSESGLPKPSMLRMKFATLDKNIVVKRIGFLSSGDQTEFSKVLVKFFAE